jgi:tRNA (guanine37-N1)-methyltransferase
MECSNGLILNQVFNMDARRFVTAIYSSQHVRPVTQVVMNLPKDAAEFLG